MGRDLHHPKLRLLAPSPWTAHTGIWAITVADGQLSPHMGTLVRGMGAVSDMDSVECFFNHFPLVGLPGQATGEEDALSPDVI